MKQYERQLGLESHKKKNGTITAGGLFFAFLPFCFCNYTSKVIPIVLCSGLFAILGFIDVDTVDIGILLLLLYEV